MKNRFQPLLFLFLSYPVHSQEVYPATFATDPSCNFQSKHDHGCVELALDQLSRDDDCARLCSARDTCEGFSLDITGKCYLHFYCIGQSHLYTDCSSPDVDIRYYVRKAASSTSCLNGGIWNTNSQSCQCVDGFLGYRCERYGESCEDLASSGQYFQEKTWREIYFINPANLTSPPRIVCSLNGKVVETHIIKYNTNLIIRNFTFNHTWDEYVSGFSYVTGGTSGGWIGLETIHYLTTVKKMQKLRISVHLMDYSFEMHQTYHGLIVGDASTNYQISYDRVTMKYQSLVNESASLPCLSPGSPIPFSTPDVDNDLDANVHCAKEAGTGWWFSECSPHPSCNPLGIPYLTDTEDLAPYKLYFEGLDMRELADEFGYIRMNFE